MLKLQKRTERLTLCIALIGAFISSGFCCTDLEWKCDSGECIALDELCDGAADCPDGSDETADSCIQQTCPSFAFRCAYGACVAGNAECNGIKECADNSDETSSLCQTDMKPRSSNCLEDQFPCLSGECIRQDSACDGYSDCPDQSDETVEACASSYCPPFAFRCGYGACIGSDKKCDGVPDCRDGSDEAYILCGTPTKKPTKPTRRPPGPTTKPTPTPTPTPTPPTPVGCVAPSIPNSRLVYEADPTIVIRPGETIPDGTSMVYLCEPGYTREGPKFNLCFHSVWFSKIDAVCVKYCTPHKLAGVTFRAECQRDGATVSCDDRIRPGTEAKILCQVKYRKPARNPPDVLVCQEDGQWDYDPFRCEPVCGEELTRITPFIVNGERTNITYVPWHVGIYHKFSGEYKHSCGGTIISAKVVISAAHCFWDSANQMLFNKSLFAVGAGKYNRDYNAVESNAQIQNIAEIAVPPEFQGDVEDYKGDIAVLVLINFLRFSPFVAPVCINWEGGAAKSIATDTYGRIAGWGIDESGDYSNELRTVDVPASSYSDCRAAVGPQLANAVTNDKFCILNKFGSVVCQGDSGGGFTVKRERGGRSLYYLWGVVSGGVPYGRKCQEFEFVSFTNIQYYEVMIMSRANSNRPN